MLRQLVFAVLLVFLIKSQVHGQTCKTANLKTKCSGWTHFPAMSGKAFVSRKLDLSNNVIKSIPTSALHDFKHLEFLNMSGCSLELVPVGTFARMPNFQSIDLSHNHLQRLSRKAFPAKILRTSDIYLHNNPWVCNCDVKWLVDLLQSGVIRQEKTPATCASPQSLHGTKFQDLLLSEYCVLTECQRCDDAALCLLNDGRHVCVCKKGFHGNGEFCADVDECASKSTHDCKKHAICENFAGSYECVCPEGFKAQANGECKDVDECKPPPVGCGPGQGVCHNTVGSFNCKCHAGLKFVKGRGCIDFDECKSVDNPCRDIPHSTCVNMEVKHHGDRGYLCKCDQGYTQVGEACVIMGQSNKLYIMAGAGSGIFVICIIIIILITVLCRRARKPKEEEGTIIMAPMGMGAPMDFAFMDLPQEGEGGEDEEWRDEGAGGDTDDDDF